MADAKRFFIHTLGCKVNQYDSRALAEALAKAGLVEAASPERADLVVVNSCAVTARAVSDARRLARQNLSRNPAARTVVAGCAASALAGSFADIPGLEVVPRDKAPALAGRAASGDLAWPSDGLTGFGRARAVLKIQEGCSRRCTYCVVPLARGPARSRPLPSILAEAESLLAAGFRELTIAGINLSQYGRDDPSGPDLWDVAAALDRLVGRSFPGQARLRLSSLYPETLGPKALEILGACPSICPHLHLSLQSADPEVLRRMGRGTRRPRDILKFLEAYGRFRPLFGLGADILTGFPGESEAAFTTTLEFCRELPLTMAHVFPYSRRPGTPAASLPDQIEPAVKKSRAAALRRLAAAKKAAFLERLAKTERTVLAVEALDPCRGVNEYYVECRFAAQPETPAAVRALVAAKPVGVGDGVLLVSDLAKDRVP